MGLPLLVRKAVEETYGRGVRRQRWWLALRLAYIFLGWLIWRTGGRSQQVISWSVVVLALFLWKAAEDIQNSWLGLQRLWRALLFGFLIFGITFMPKGLEQAYLLLDFCRTDAPNLFACLSAFLKELAIIMVGVDLILLPHLLRNVAENLNSGRISFQGWWQTLLIVYTILGGFILFEGVWYAIYFGHRIQRALYEGLILAAVGGGLVMLPHFLQRLFRRGSNNNPPKDSKLPLPK